MAVDAGRIQIPAGWGEVPLAVKDNTFDLAAPLEAAAKIKAEGAQTDESEATTALRQAQLPQEAAKSSLATMDLNDAQIARTMRSIDWSDPNAAASGDAALQRLVDGGNADAGQYIGKLSQATTDRLADGLEGAAVRQPSAASAALAGGSDGGGGPAVLRQQLAQLPDQVLSAAYQKASDYDAALQRIYHAPNPQKQWDIEAQEHAPQLIGRYSPLRLGQMMKETESNLPIMASIMDEKGLGLPGAPPATEYKEAGGNLYAIDQYAAGGPTVKPVTNNSTLVGTDDQNRGIYHGPQGETVGDHPLGAKPGTDRDTVFQQKQDAWIAVHPGDNAGALAYASGRGGTMQPAQIQTAAAAQAAKDLQALSAAGSPPADPNAYLAQQTALHASEISAAAASTAPGGAGAGAPAADPNAPPPPPSDDFSAARRDYGTALSSLQQQLGNARPGTPQYKQLEQNLQKVRSDIAQHIQPMANPGVTPPPRAVQALKTAGEGVPVAFPNGTTWVIRNGQPVRLW